MKFLYPQFLYALTAILIPIIIHLFNFRKFKTVYFSNVRFLKDIKKETKAHSQLKHLLILLSRILAISSLVFAFAQPYIPVNNTIIHDKYAVSIYIDNSFSMNAENENGQLLSIAKDKARIITESYKSTDDFNILTNDLKGKHQRIINKKLILDEIDEVESSPNLNLISDIINKQQNILNSSNAKEKTIYIISDFQEITSNINDLELDSNINIRLLPLSRNEMSNIYIDSCWLNTPNPIVGEEINLKARLKNIGQKKTDFSINLSINNQPKAIANTDISNEKIIDFYFVCDSIGWKEGKITLTDFPIQYDNDFYFSFEIKDDILVQSLYQEQENKSLNKLFNKDENIKYSTQKISQLNYDNLMLQQLIILTEINEITSGLSRTLNNFVEKGGSLLVFPSEKINYKDYQLFLNSLNANYYISLNESPIKISRLNDKHSIFDGVFKKLNEKLNFPQIKKYFKITQFTKTEMSSLLDFENDQSVIGEYNYKKGKLYLSSIGISDSFSNFNKHALFVPILYNIASHSSIKQSLYYFIGEKYIQSNFKLSSDKIYSIENNEISFIPELQIDKLGVYDQIKQQGHYDLTENNKKLSGLTFNYKRIESNLKLLELKKIKNISSKHKNILTITNKNKTLAKEIKEINNGKTLWKLCIIFTLIFLAIETIIIKLT